MANDFSKITIDGTTYNVKVPNKLTVGSKTFDGSSAVTIAASDLGLSNALQFIGETTTALSDGSTTSSVKIGSTTHTAAIGDVVLYGAKEFVWQGSMWKELGDGSSHALKTISISAGGGLTGGGTLEANRTISHADTSSQASVSASGRRYITGVTLDGYGHVTGLTTGTETVADSNTTYSLSKSGSTITLTGSDGSTTSVTDSNTQAVSSVNSKTGAVSLGASDVGALSLDGGTINKSKTVKMDASANSNGANLKWGTVNSKNPYIGYASDQTDGTFVIGSLFGTNYASGLAIGGGSGNLLWKGTKVATTSDIPSVPTVNNATLTIQKNGTKVATFTANASSNATANITVPTTASEVGALPISGGTIAGTSGDTPLYIKSAHATASYEGFQRADGTTLGYFGYSSKDNPTVYLSSGAKTIYHAGNFPSATASALGGIKISFSNGVLTITT